MMTVPDRVALGFHLAPRCAAIDKSRDRMEIRVEMAMEILFLFNNLLIISINFIPS